jgi:hypothetical protein
MKKKKKSKLGYQADALKAAAAAPQPMPGK